MPDVCKRIEDSPLIVVAFHAMVYRWVAG